VRKPPLPQLLKETKKMEMESRYIEEGKRISKLPPWLRPPPLTDERPLGNDFRWQYSNRLLPLLPTAVPRRSPFARLADERPVRVPERVEFKQTPKAERGLLLPIEPTNAVFKRLPDIDPVRTRTTPMPDVRPPRQKFSVPEEIKEREEPVMTEKYAIEELYPKSLRNELWEV
jgi:hypothetical protein